jgi:hypothetical protein
VKVSDITKAASLFPSHQIVVSGYCEQEQARGLSDESVHVQKVRNFNVAKTNLKALTTPHYILCAMQRSAFTV